MFKTKPKTLKQYCLYKGDGLVMQGPMWKLVQYIIESQPDRFTYRLDQQRIENNLRLSLIRKMKPYGYTIREVKK